MAPVARSRNSISRNDCASVYDVAPPAPKATKTTKWLSPRQVMGLFAVHHHIHHIVHKIVHCDVDLEVSWHDVDCRKHKRQRCLRRPHVSFTEDSF